MGMHDVPSSHLSIVDYGVKNGTFSAVPRLNPEPSRPLPQAGMAPRHAVVISSLLFSTKGAPSQPRRLRQAAAMAPIATRDVHCTPKGRGGHAPGTRK